MAEAAEVAQGDWDFLTLVAWWNLYGLPALLALAVGALAVYRRVRRPNTDRLSAAATIQRIGLIHLVLGLRALVQFAQELQTLRTMGIFQSNPVSNLITALAVLINPLLGVGLWRFRPGARRMAIVWYLLWSSIAAWVTYWVWHYHAFVNPADWPDHVVGKVMPWFLLFVILRPQTRRLFSSQKSLAASPAANEALAEEATPPSQPVWPIVGAAVLVFLLITCSTLLVDALDWMNRMAAGLDPGSPR